MGTCPECGEEALKKQLSAARFRLKGGDWYKTDFKGGNKKKAAGSETGGGHSCGGGCACA